MVRWPWQRPPPPDWPSILLPREHDFLTLWADSRDGAAMPVRRALPPERLAPWLGWLHLLRPEKGGRDFRYEIYSTRSFASRPPEMTGRRVSEWQDERTAYALDFYRQAFRTAGPVYSRSATTPGVEWTTFSRLCVPLGEEGRITHLLTLMSERRKADAGAFDVAPVDLESALAGYPPNEAPA